MPNTIQVENYPTPLGKTVNGMEKHLRLKRGRVTIVPLERLMDRMLETFRDINQDPHFEPQVVGTLGPIEGFRLRYVVRRVIRPATQDLMQPVETSLAYAELVPVSGDLGEPVDAALEPGSQFRQSLGRLRRRAAR